MANLNKVLLIGRLTRDPEIRYTPGGLAIAEFGLAVNRFRKGQDGSRQEETAFIDMTAFGRTAELAQQYLAKGRQVFVEGHLRFEQWTNAEGQKRSKLNVVIDNLQFLDSRGGDGGGGGQYGQQESRPAEEPTHAPHAGINEPAPSDSEPAPSDSEPTPPSGSDIPF